ncbi:hypothetical protein BN1708_011363 [Verticillium longisporum]|uniref:WSC domain-containing protein n=2 Tax=Verticillium longisporum TaxID=100787 RepID=A0A0G4KZC7_VERLO|nr:hypothetical protein BN1708_011363 [Verticillium longisporum]
MRWVLGLLTAALPALVTSKAPTDSTQDVDVSQSGYLPNHNLNPSTVTSGFRNLWEWQAEDTQELFLAKPLVYTPPGGSELLITSSEKNNVRIFDAKTGSLIRIRQLQAPFNRDDANCGDIPNWIGITGTPIIDTATGIMYVFSKGYRDGFTSGQINGVYKMYALQLPSLEDVPGFPTLIDGANADNDPARYIIGGVALQRPALSDVNGHIVAGFGSHCGRGNYTGYLVAVSKQPGVGVTSMWATESAPGAPTPQPLDITVENGGKAGIWQGGVGHAVVGSSVFFVAANGQGKHNGNVPASGRSPCSTLSHSTVRMELSPEGKWRQVDYFQPYDYSGLNAGDRDVGSSGLALLDGSVFRGAGVDRMGIIAGKEGRAYLLNVNDLGGFRNGPGAGDNTIQTIELGGAVYGAFGSYPHEGGYIYSATIGGPMKAFRLGHDTAGKPVFSLAGQSAWTATASRIGLGQVTVTSDNGQPGTGIVWVTDMTLGLVAFRAIPENGVLVPIQLPSGLRGANKFQRPVFGDGRVYYQATTNRLYCLGTSVNQAITCSDVDFGTVELGSATSATISCTAQTSVTAITGCSVSSPSFICNNSTLPKGAISAGTSFTFGVTWDLENNAAGVFPGYVSGSLTLGVTAPAQFAAVSIVSLEGTVVNRGPFLHSPSASVPLGTVVLRQDGLTTLSASAVLANVGNSSLTIEGLAFQTAGGAYNNVSGPSDLGSGFSSTAFPVIGSKIDAGAETSLGFLFDAGAANLEVGAYTSTVTVWSDGGVLTFELTATVASPPVVAFEVADGQGGWNSLSPHYTVPFGDVTTGGSAETHIRVCNRGGSPMTVTISKAPDSEQLRALNPDHELGEGLQIRADDCAIGTVGVRAGPIQPNTPALNIRGTWTLTTNGLDPNTGEDAGLKDILFTARIVPRQLGPVLENGEARYQYVGCFADTRMGRNLQTQVNNGAQQLTNTIQQCTQLCRDRGFIFSGMQYRRECWCGGPPQNIRYPQTYTDPDENRCTFGCMGDETQACGGDGGHMSLYADVTAFDIAAFLESIGQGTTPGTTTTTVATTTAVTTAVTTAATSTTVVTTSTSVVVTSAATSGEPESSAEPVSSAAPDTTTSSAATPTGASPLNPNQPALVNNEWEYAGCFSDLVNNVRTLGASQTASDDMTLEKCGAFCSGNGNPHNYFGLTYGRECFCGWTLDEAALRAPESDCSSACIGSSTGLCGGWRKLSVFRNIEVHTPPAGPEHVQQVLDYQWEGCQTEATTGRALSGKSFASDTLSVDSCAAFCAVDNFLYMGVEYGRECYCGNTINAGSVPAAVTQCSTLCKGNSLQYCGAGSRLDLYRLEPGSGSSSTAVASPTTVPATSEPPSVPSTTEVASTVTSNVISSEAPVSSAEPTSSELPVSSEAPISAEPSVTSIAAVSSDTPSSSEVAASSVAAVSSEAPASSQVPTSSAAVSSVEAISSIEPSASSEPVSSEASAPSQVVSSVEESSTVQSSIPESSIIAKSSTVVDVPTSSFLSVPSVSASTSASSFFTSTIESSSSGPTATPTNGYYYVGCFQDTSSGHALPHLLSNRSVTPELCFDFARQRAPNAPTPTAAPAYVFIEYHHECYAGNTFDFKGSAVTSLIGTRACTNYCYGSVLTYTTSGTTTVTTKTDNRCGGPKMFDLYATTLPVDFPTTGGPLTTKVTGTPRP